METTNLAAIIGGTVGGLFLSAVGASALVRLANKLVPWEKIGDATERGCAVVSRMGRGKWGRAFWEPVETFFQEKLLYLLQRANRGFDADDEVKTEIVRQETPQPPSA